MDTYCRRRIPVEQRHPLCLGAFLLWLAVTTVLLLGPPAAHADGPSQAALTSGAAVAASPAPLVDMGPVASGLVTQAQQGPPPSCVALDTSGSMEENDAERYGASVINLIADLTGSGIVSVLTFSGEGPQGVKPLGTFDLSSGPELDALRRRVAELRQQRRDGATPTAEMVAAIYELLRGQNAPAGAGCIALSDGEPVPDGPGQYARIDLLIPRFAERGWKLHAVALGGGVWVERFHRVAAQLGGAGLVANNARDLIAVATHAFAAYRSEAPPVVESATIGAGNRTVIRTGLDPTIKELIVVVTRPSSQVEVSLLDARRTEVKRDDPRLVGFHADDPKFVFFGLKDTQALGVGDWSVEARGAPGVEVFVAISKRSSLRVEMTEPKAGVVLANRPTRLCARLLDADSPLPALAGASVRLLVTAGDGKLVQVALRDDGRPESGDSSATDGVFCGKLLLAEGNHRFVAEATTPGAGGASVAGSVYAEIFPSFDALRLPASLERRDGESLNLPLGQIKRAGGNVDPAIVNRLALVLRAPTGAVRRIPLDPRSALVEEAGEKNLLRAAFPVYLQDGGERSAAETEKGIPILYHAVLEVEYRHLGQIVVDDAALALDIPVTVKAWPGLCGLLPAGRAPCAAIWELEQVRVGLLYATLGVFGLVVVGAILRWFVNRGLDEESGGLFGDY